jgi:hypothetical protein
MREEEEELTMLVRQQMSQERELHRGLPQGMNANCLGAPPPRLARDATDRLTPL